MVGVASMRTRYRFLAGSRAKGDPSKDMVMSGYSSASAVLERSHIVSALACFWCAHAPLHVARMNMQDAVR